MGQTRSHANCAGDRHGTLIGDPVWQPTGGKVDGALQFDGMDDYVNAGFVLNPADGPFSACAWVAVDTSDQFAIPCDGDLYFGAGKDISAGSLFSGLIDHVKI